ncbi:MAG: hypothetical protein U5N85_15780 [Arcicella sp.]|nr:hypothetical protein [Arcicella sp.]
MVKAHDWGYLAASSHYVLAKEIKFSLQEGDVEDAIEGLFGYHYDSYSEMESSASKEKYELG